MATDGCVSSRLVPVCEGEDSCGFYGLPHVLCVPVPPYAKGRTGEALTVEPSPPIDAIPAPQDELNRAAAKRGG